LPSSILPPLPDTTYDREDEFKEFKGQKRICISGMPGVGKSTLAIKYGYSRQKEEKPALVCFFQAETEAKLKVDFVGLAKLLKISEDNDDHRIELVYQKLKEISDLEILFIFDNVENYQFVKKYVCNLPEAISVLVTVRNKETVQRNYVKWHDIKLKPFLEEESKKYIKKGLDGYLKIEDGQIKEILEIIGVGYKVIPFHLNKVVTLLRDTCCSFEETLEQIKEDKEFLRTGLYEKFMKSSLLAEMIDQKKNGDWNKALQELKKNLIVTVNAEGEGISVHRLLQKELSLYFEKKFENKEINEIRERFVEIIDKNLKNQDIASWASKLGPFTHADRLIETDWFRDSNQFPDSEIKASIFEKMGHFFNQYRPIIKQSNSVAQTRILNKMFLRERAKECFLKTLKIREKLYSGDHYLKVRTYICIALACRYLGEHDNASNNYEKALNMSSGLGIADDSKQQVRTHHLFGELHHILGLVDQDSSKFDKALEQFIKAFEMKKRLRIDDDDLLAKLYHDIGAAYYSMKQPKNAKFFFLKTLEITEKLYHGDHFQKVSTYNLIAWACHDLGEHVCASKYLEKALHMSSGLGIADDSKQQVLTHSLFGFVYKNLGEFEKALEQFKKAFEIRERLRIDDDDLLAILYNKIGDTYLSMKQPKNAKKCFLKTLEITEKLYHGDHFQKVSAYNHIACACLELEEHVCASKYLEKALHMSCRLGIADDPQQDDKLVARLYENIGATYLSKKEPKKAAEHFIKSYKIYARLYSADSPEAKTVFVCIKYSIRQYPK